MPMMFPIQTKIMVSIHASVKDATDHIGYQPIYAKVSIHASVKDATPCL